MNCGYVSSTQLLGAAVGIAICFFYTPKIVSYLRAPYEKVMRDTNLDPHLQTITPTDGFTSYMKISMWSGIVLASPWIFYHLWKFISAGLYPKEKRYVYMAVPASAILFILGSLLSVLVLSPLTLQFLVTFNKDWLGIVSAFTFQSYMSFMVNMMLGFGLAFETPIVMFFLNKFGMLSLSTDHKITAICRPCRHRHSGDSDARQRFCFAVCTCDTAVSSF